MYYAGRRCCRSWRPWPPCAWSCLPAGRIRLLLGQAHSAGARIAVLPEYLSLELAASLGAPVFADLPASLAGIQRYRQAWLALFAGLAAELDMHIVAGSFLLEHVPGRYRNRCDWFTPDGRALWQDKLQLTGFEKKTGVIDAGDALKVFDIDGLRVGVAICYDSEFPLPVRAQYEAGARLLVVPSCTDTVAGATRVRVGCLARALENRLFVAPSVTAGLAAWSPALDMNTGQAAVLRRWMWAFPLTGCWRRPPMTRSGRWPGWTSPGSRPTVPGPRWPMTAIGPGSAARPCSRRCWADESGVRA